MIVVFKIVIIINQPARPDRRDPLSVREHAQRRVGACSQPHLWRTRGSWYSDHYHAVHLGNQADVHLVEKYVAKK